MNFFCRKSSVFFALHYVTFPTLRILLCIYICIRDSKTCMCTLRAWAWGFGLLVQMKCRPHVNVYLTCIYLRLLYFLWNWRLIMYKKYVVYCFIFSNYWQLTRFFRFLCFKNNEGRRIAVHYVMRCKSLNFYWYLHENVFLEKVQNVD